MALEGLRQTAPSSQKFLFELAETLHFISIFQGHRRSNCFRFNFPLTRPCSTGGDCLLPSLRDGHLYIVSPCGSTVRNPSSASHRNILTANS